MDHAVRYFLATLPINVRFANRTSNNGGEQRMMRKTFIDAPGDGVFDVYGFQGQLVTEASATLVISGQVGSGNSDLPGQLDEALSHIHELLSLAEMDWPNVVKLTILTTDVETLLGLWSRVRRRFEPTGSVPPNTLAEVSRFAHRAYLSRSMRSRCADIHAENHPRSTLTSGD